MRFRSVTSHGNAVGLYFYDPEDNVCEVYWTTPWKAHQPYGVAVDLTQDIDEVKHEVEEDVKSTPPQATRDPESFDTPKGTAGQRRHSHLGHARLSPPDAVCLNVAGEPLGFAASRGSKLWCALLFRGHAADRASRSLRTLLRAAGRSLHEQRWPLRPRAVAGSLARSRNLAAHPLMGSSRRRNVQRPWRAERRNAGFTHFEPRANIGGRDGHRRRQAARVSDQTTPPARSNAAGNTMFFNEGVAAGRSAQRACSRSSDWRAGPPGLPDPVPSSRHATSRADHAASQRARSAP